MSNTRNKLAWLRDIPVHVFLFAVYPVLALLAFNISQVDLSSGFRPLLVAVLAAGLLLLAFYLIYRDWKRAALLGTILLISFFAYGHIYILIKGIHAGGLYLFRHRTLVPLWLILTALMIWWASRKSRNLPALTYGLNLVGLFLLILPLLQLISFSIQSRISQADAEKDTATTLSLEPGDPPPDIYYIILDGYGRADVLEKQFGYDNSPFLNKLRSLGFVVADCAQSNYAQTQESLASSLNFSYINDLSDRFTPGSTDRTGLDALIHHGAVRASLEKAGYKTVAFATGFLATEMSDADYFLSPGYSSGELNEFESLLMETTFARLIQDGNRFSMQTSGSERYRERTLFALDKLDKLAYIKGPKFVFVHLVIPHPPYVFGPTGGPIVADQSGDTKTQVGASHYRDQVIYINSRMMDIVPKILANSSTPPVIVIQGDHGPTVPSTSRARMSNLNAYYLPGAGKAVYPTITPVNTFRVIFNIYFGQSLPLLEDKSLYSDYDDPFTWKVVPNNCRADQ